ncbi:hypothetical protein FIBSPDRAFT_853973 [Athelia psychrophila]|uniref:Secreted protein n=1 Tax=Athelia psychrophila TaxID=1759441 RepID=A0A166QIW6_9AGAM|nr:hypothetical protein FIBSPDRAFT_853973 [Fibularhizoctonia sp. CBS 109695]
MLQFRIPSFAIFNNIVLLAFLLLSGTSPVRGTPPYPTPGSSGMLRSYGSARPSRRPVARVRPKPNKVVFKDASSGKNAYSLHQFGKTAVYKAIQTCVTRVLATSGPTTSGPTTTMH